MFPEIRSVMVLSTAHVGKKDGALLAEAEQNWPLAGLICGAHGTLMHVRPLAEHRTTHEEVLYAAGFSRKFINLFKHIIDANVDYVIFDADGPKIPGLKEYNS